MTDHPTDLDAIDCDNYTSGTCMSRGSTTPCGRCALVAEVRELRAKVTRVEAVHDDWTNRILPRSAWPHVHHWLRDLRAALAGESA